MKILHLTLKKKWFDLIQSGGKTEEYREIKPYWTTRLMDGDQFKEFDAVQFKNGYQTDAPTMLFTWKATYMGYSPVFKTETYIISLGLRLL